MRQDQRARNNPGSPERAAGSVEKCHLVLDLQLCALQEEGHGALHSPGRGAQCYLRLLS